MDLTILNDPLAVKTYLEQEGIAYDPAEIPFTLRGIAKRRMKRRHNEITCVAAQRALFCKANLISIQDLKDTLVAIHNAAEDVDKHYRIKACIDSLPPALDMVKTKHMVGTGNICRGTVYNGKCYVCKAQTEGVIAYSFKATLTETDSENVSLNVTCAEGAGRSMFDMNAGDFSALSQEQKADKIERISNVPITAGVWIKYEVEKDDPLVCIYDVALA